MRHSLKFRGRFSHKPNVLFTLGKVLRIHLGGKTVNKGRVHNSNPLVWFFFHGKKLPLFFHLNNAISKRWKKLLHFVPIQNRVNRIFAHREFRPNKFLSSRNLNPNIYLLFTPISICCGQLYIHLRVLILAHCESHQQIWLLFTSAFLHLDLVEEVGPLYILCLRLCTFSTSTWWLKILHVDLVEEFFACRSGGRRKFWNIKRCFTMLCNALIQCVEWGKRCFAARFVATKQRVKAGKGKEMFRCLKIIYLIFLKYIWYF